MANQQQLDELRALCTNAVPATMAHLGTKARALIPVVLDQLERIRTSLAGFIDMTAATDTADAVEDLCNTVHDLESQMETALTEEHQKDTSKRSIAVLHAIYHERDFRIRVNDPTINFTRRQLGLLFPVYARVDGCPACAAGLDHLELQPEACDRYPQ
jgi:phosphate uptake regulator